MNNATCNVNELIFLTKLFQADINTRCDHNQSRRLKTQLVITDSYDMLLEIDQDDSRNKTYQLRVSQSVRCCVCESSYFIKNVISSGCQPLSNLDSCL